MEWKKNTSSWSGFAFIARKTHPSCVGSVFPCQLITGVQQRRACSLADRSLLSQSSMFQSPLISEQLPQSHLHPVIKVVFCAHWTTGWILAFQNKITVTLHYKSSLMLQVTVCGYFHFDTKDLQLYVLRPSPRSLVFLSPSTCGWSSMLCSRLPLRMSVFQVLLAASY